MGLKSDINVAPPARIAENASTFSANGFRPAEEIEIGPSKLL